MIGGGRDSTTCRTEVQKFKSASGLCGNKRAEWRTVWRTEWRKLPPKPEADG